VQASHAFKLSDVHVKSTDTDTYAEVTFAELDVDPEGWLSATHVETGNLKRRSRRSLCRSCQNKTRAGVPVKSSPQAASVQTPSSQPSMSESRLRLLHAAPMLTLIGTVQLSESESLPGSSSTSGSTARTQSAHVLLPTLFNLGEDCTPLLSGSLLASIKRSRPGSAEFRSQQYSLLSVAVVDTQTLPREDDSEASAVLAYIVRWPVDTHAESDSADSMYRLLLPQCCDSESHSPPSQSSKALFVDIAPRSDVHKCLPVDIDLILGVGQTRSRSLRLVLTFCSELAHVSGKCRVAPSTCCNLLASWNRSRHRPWHYYPSIQASFLRLTSSECGIPVMIPLRPRAPDRHRFFPS
jgi:hypothetical protein